MPEPRKLRVFLCHASQDKPIVRELYQRLLAKGWIDPWLDEEKIHLHQNRDIEVEKALNVLKFHAQHSSIPLSKLVLSAVKNYEAKTGLRAEDSALFVKEIKVDSAQVLKRFRPAPQGRAYRIRKRSNHVTVVLDTIKEQKTK